MTWLKRSPSLTKILLAAGLLLNPWTLGLILSPDGKIEDRLFIVTIVVLEIFLVLLGSFLSLRSNALRYLLGGTFAVFLLLPFYSTSIYFERVRTAESRAPDIDQEILRRVLALENSTIATLDLETARILYGLHSRQETVRFSVPENGVLDTGTGIDPKIAKMFQGTVTFEIEMTQEDGSKTSLFRKTYDLSKPSTEIFRWQAVSVDLAEYENQELQLVFSKHHIEESHTPPRVVFDLEPTDLMFWRKPKVRPLKLERKKNVIFVSLDTLRADHLHFAGYPRETSPTLDRLASGGVDFTQCISQAPWTTPSHHSMFTATYPSVHRANRSAQEFSKGALSGLDPDLWWDDRLPTMASILSEEGYTTGAFTGNGMIAAKYGFLKGHDFYNHSELREGSDVEQVFSKAMAWMQRNRERTFFLFLHSFEPHWPYVDQFFVQEEDVSPTSKMDHMIARYDGDIRRADQQIGRLVRFLEENSLIDQTLLVFTSDHGEEFRESEPRDSHRLKDHGHTLFDEILRVPLIFYGLGPSAQGITVESQVRSIDILPTVMDYLGIRASATFQGESLRPMIDGKEKGPLPAFSEATTYGTARESLRANGFKYIHRSSYGQLSHPDSARFLLTPIDELFDLNSDPGEVRNLASDFPEKVREMQDLMLTIFPGKDFSQHGSAGSPHLEGDATLLKALRSLGYID